MAVRHCIGQHKLGKKVVKMLLAAKVDKESQDDEGNRPIHWAAFAGEGEVVKVLLAASVDKEAKNKDGYSPFYIALIAALDLTKPGRKKMVESLAEGVARLAQDKYSTRLSHLAATGGHMEVAKILLAAGANGTDKEAQNEFAEEAIAFGSRARSSRNSEAHLAAGADKEMQDVFGRRPLYWAALRGQVEVVKLLLAVGADKEAQNKDGLRPYEIAQRKFETEENQNLKNAFKNIVELLRE